jgi:molybdate transport system substrate-binding protein
MNATRPCLRAIQIFIALAVLLGLCACAKQSPKEQQNEARQITVAAAANLTEAFEEIGKQFTAKTGIRVIYSFGSTADLTKQIENGAPFDAFASADVEHIDELNRKGLIVPETRALYARGRLVLWIPPPSQTVISQLEDVTKPEVKTIAIAKPELAPYGKASIETLQALHIWPQIEPKVVYGANVSQVKQYGSSGNVDVAFIPLSLVKPYEGKYIEVDERLHKPIHQAMGVIQASGKQEQARRFASYVLSADGQALLERYGYRKPSAE